LLQISPNWFLGNWTLDPALKWIRSHLICAFIEKENLYLDVIINGVVEGIPISWGGVWLQRSRKVLEMYPGPKEYKIVMTHCSSTWTQSDLISVGVVG